MHIRNDAPGAESLPLESLYGRCKVIDLTHVEQEIHRQDLEGRCIEDGDIVLLKTRNSHLGYDRFREDFVHVKMDAAELLVESGARTLGFDYSA